MAAPLASIQSPVPGITPHYDITIDCQVLSQLEETFSDAPVPVLFVGKVGKTLKKSLPLEFIDESEDSSSESEEHIEEPKEDSLLVWPKPVLVQGSNLLLMKMWNFNVNEEDEDKREVIERTLCVALSLSAHCVINFEPKEVSCGLKMLQRIYKMLLPREDEGLHRVHFVVLSKVAEQEINEYKSRPEGQNTDFLSRRDWREPAGFYRHLLNGSGAPVPRSMREWTRNLHLAMSFVNIDSDREFFVQNFPRFGMLQNESFAHLLEELKQKQDTLRQASVCKFITRGRSPSCKFDESFMATHQKDMYQVLQTVVLTVFGEPSIGKSTFLNSLVQFTCRRRKRDPFFAEGSNGATRDSAILPCPLPLPGSSNQLLLIDLEGLPAADSQNEMDNLTSLNLASGVLAVTSVPCFFVKDPNADQQKQIERYIERYRCLSSRLDFSCDRIFFLSNDQNFRPGEQSNNVQMNEWISKLNKQFFGGRPVICLMNKPSFENHSKEMCKDFLETFLAKCNFPKNISVAKALEGIHFLSQNFITEQDQFPVNFAIIDASRNESVQFYRRKSDLLLSIEPNPDIVQNSEKYSLRPINEVMHMLRNNFETYSEITPILSIGNNTCGRSSILDSLLQRELGQFFNAEAILGDFSNFASEGRPPGLYVWPNPVRLGGVTLLLMKMWGMDFRESNEALNALNNQVISALLCITSVCLVCTEKNALFHALESVQNLYREMRQVLGLTVSQFVVFAEKREHFASPESQEKLKMVQACAEGPITRFLFRGNIGISESCSDELSHLLSSQDLHTPFIASHRNIQRNINAETKAHSITLMLEMLMRVVNLDLGYRHFVETIPRFAHAEYKQELEEFEAFEKYVNYVRTAEVLKLLVKGGDSYRFDTSVIQILQKNYKNEKPTIVLVAIGTPGIGKSTFLNRFIQMITRSRRCVEVFKTGNTNDHTTRESQVLSHPLNLGGNQLMLIDLEGLDGFETDDKAKRELQQKLVYAILRIVSVPCILVKSDLPSKEFTERAIKMLNKIRNKFGLPMERVHLLFHDRDINPNGFDNEVFLEFVGQMNADYYKSLPVVKIRNKPSFRDSEKAEMCEAFLKDLIADSNFPKRNLSGSFTNISELLVEMKCIMDCSNLVEIAYSRQELIEMSRIEGEKTKQLKKIAKEIIGTEDIGLIGEFDRQYDEFRNACFLEIESQTEKVRRHVMTTLENEASKHRLELSQIEYCYRAVRRLSDTELRKAMKELLLYFYRDAWWINTFLERADELKLKLEKIRERYPQQHAKLSRVLVKFEKKRINLRNWFIANYSINAGTTVLSGGLGVAVKGVTLAVTAERLIAGAVISSLTSLGRLIYSVTHTLILTDTAMELYNFPLFSSKTHLNQKVSNLLQAGDDARLYVMAVVGTKKSMASNLLNEFVHQVLPFTPYSMKAFKASELTQIIHCSYQHPDIEVSDANTHAFLIYLQMKNNMKKSKYIRARKLATEIFMRIPLTCLFLQDPDLFADKMLDDAFAARGEWDIPSVQPKLAVVHSLKSRKSAFFTKLVSLGVPHEKVRVKEFDEQGIKSALLSVKVEFDKSTPISPSSLLEVLMKAEVS